jgi:hypothetical protein
VKKLSNVLKLACASIVVAGALAAWPGDARAGGEMGCWFGFYACVDSCARKYTAPAEMNTCGTFCGDDYWHCIGGFGPGPEIPGNYAD